MLVLQSKYIQYTTLLTISLLLPSWSEQPSSPTRITSKATYFLGFYSCLRHLHSHRLFPIQQPDGSFKNLAMKYYFLQNLAEALYFTQSKSKSLIMAHKPLHGTAPSWSSESFPTIHLLTQPHWPPCQSLNSSNTLLRCLYLLHILPGTFSPCMSLCLVSSPLTILCSPSQ